MKKLTAILLALVLLIPGVLGASAETDSISSFEENFDSYPDGQITNHKLNDPSAWGYGMVGGSSNIRDKALVLNGTVSYQNLEIPGQLTAAGAFAQEQTWSITVTVPEGLEEKAEIAVLRYEGKGTPTTNRGTAITDGGLVLRDYTLYYTQLMDKDDPVNIRGEEKSLCKLTPGTYTLKRVMNMLEPEDFTCSIFVLDQAGKEVAKVKNVQIPHVTQLTTVTFGVNGVSREVIFDDYAIWASGVAANLTLTDAAGKALDAAEPHTGPVSYRLSWFNATGKEKTYILMAAYYEDGKVTGKQVIQELTLPPEGEGAETGTVETAEGQQVKLYLRDPAQERARLIRIILMGVAAAAALAAVVVGVIYLVKFMKKQKEKKAAKLQAFLNCDDE